MILSLINRDFKMAFLNISQILSQILFFFITISIFSISNNYESYNKISIIWFCLIFSVIIGSSNFLKEDYKDGLLEQVLLDRGSLDVFFMVRIFNNWLIYSLPLIVFIPLLALILDIKSIDPLNLVALSVIVTLIVNLVVCFCSSLVVSLNKNESLLTILILPLLVPVIIFANSAFFDLNINYFYNALFFLILLFIFLKPILVMFGSYVLKISL